ncbi:MAG: WYL domain-containing transcriptional regulator [Clostridia bacterium]|nr:WYL domain-containing transcriptional regulator [Clostridia bacterium]
MGNYQKLKLLYLVKIFQEKTDEEHPITIEEIISSLSFYDITAERKAIYSDIKSLQDFGYDIISVRGKKFGYYLASRDFQLAELKLLADAVSSARFITKKKSDALIKQIGQQASIHQARYLQRQIGLSGRIKTFNEKIYYNVDKIHESIADNRDIEFLYFDYNAKKEKVYKRDGAVYRCSPYSLHWEDGNYYLIAYYPVYDRIVHFRVDKMENINITEEKRKDIHEIKGFEKADITNYENKLFSMFSGDEIAVKLKVDNSLAGVMIDKFGMDSNIIKADENSFYLMTKVVIGEPFWGWLFQFGNKVELISPEKERNIYREKLNLAKSIYEDKKNEN